MQKQIRKFKTGATRDTELGKLDFEGFLSPIVLERFGQYMDKHRTQSDGTRRDADNWQALYGEDHYAICMKSAWRHFLAFWKAHRGYNTEEDIEESAMALMFNLMAYMHKRLQGQHKK